MGTKLLVTNLPLDLDSSDLEDMFTMVGDVRAALVLRDEQSDVSRGVGQVEMTTEREALDGIALFNGQVKAGHRLSVREDKPHLAIKSPPTTARRAIMKKAGAARRQNASPSLQGKPS